jgi:hypothetical protein
LNEAIMSVFHRKGFHSALVCFYIYIFIFLAEIMIRDKKKILNYGVGF